MTYCSAPWTTVNIKTDGQISYCCVTWELLGDNINDSTLVKGREDIINGKVLDVCKKACYDVEPFYQSQRQITNQYFPIKKETLTPEINPEDIQYIDLRIGNICNYMCLMCNESQSHLWGKFNNKLNPHIHWDKKQDRIMEFISQCKNLKRINLSGGEPFYNREQIFQIMNNLKKDITLKFITNVSVCDDEIITKLNQFSKGVLNCSIDGVEHWAEIQRYRSKWSEVEKNILKFSKELHSGWRINLVPTFSVLNTTGIPKFLKWYNDNLSSDTKVNFDYSILYQPNYLTLYSLPQDVRDNIIEETKKLNINLTEKMNNLLISVSKNIPPDENNISQLKKFLDDMKSRLNLDIVDKIPEIGGIVNE